MADKAVFTPWLGGDGGRDIHLISENAFGSGRHASTALAVTMMQAHLKPGDTLVDVGTGSGILMIVAAGLGAGKVVGFDKHPSSMATARKNLQLNRVPAERFHLLAADRLDVLTTRFDMAVVNILPEIILGLLEGVARVVRPGGILAASGMISGNTHRVETGMHDTGFDTLKKYQKGPWVGITAQRR